MTAIAVALAVGFPQTADAAGSGSFTKAATGLPDWLAGQAAAAPLPGNRVLVAGGYDSSLRYGSYAADEIEILDARGMVVGTAAMAHARWGPAAAPLPDGRVLIVGGLEGGSGYWPPGAVTATSEIFDPRTNSLSSGPSLQTARMGAVAVALPDGRTLVIGGEDDDNDLASVEVLHPGANAFEPAGSLRTPRASPAAAALPDGRIMVVGGDGMGTETEIYDPGTGTSAGGPAFPRLPSQGVVAAPLPDGRILFAGGWPGITPYLRGAEVYQPNLGRFSSKGIGRLNDGRAYAAAASLQDGRVMVVGGRGAFFNQTAEIFGATNTFRSKLVGRRLVVKVRASGSVTVRGVAHMTHPGVAQTAAGRKLRIKRSSSRGGPGKIRVRLRISRRGKRLLHQGRLALKLRINFTPVGGLPRTKVKRVRSG
jgi:hypothetical protein